MRGRRRKGRGKEGKVRRDWGEKERDSSSFLVHAFLPLGSPFSGDCLYSTVVESSDEMLTQPDYSQPRSHGPLRPDILSRSPMTPVGENPGKEVAFTRGGQG